MADQEPTLSIEASLYGSPEDETPKTDLETSGKEESKAEETPGKEGHVEDEAKPPSKEEAVQKEDQSDLDWMDKTPEPSHSDNGEAKKSKDQDIEIDYDGRKIKVSELQQEAKNREAGFNQKMMEVAEKRKSLDEKISAVEIEKAGLVTSLTEVENFLKSNVQQEPDWEKLKKTHDNEDILLKRIEYQDYQEKLKKVSEKRQILENDQVNRRVDEQTRILADKYFPEWKDPKKCEEHIKSVFSGAEKFYDFKYHETTSIMLDHRVFRMVADGVRWRNHKAAQNKLAENKSSDTPPKTAKASGDKLDTKPGDKVNKLTPAESLYPQYSEKPAEVL